MLSIVIVSEDTVRYMSAASTPENNFLVDDPSWAIDFAPNGTCQDWDSNKPIAH